ncbi:hypothetical protein FS837_007353, partial [Tulasnella sp. UAMH 9824]
AEILVNVSYRAVITDFDSARVLHRRVETDIDQEQFEGETAAEVMPALEKCAYASQLQVSVAGEQLTLAGPAWSLRWGAPEVLFGKRLDLPRDLWTAGPNASKCCALVRWMPSPTRLSEENWRRASVKQWWKLSEVIGAWHQEQDDLLRHSPPVYN